MNSIVQAGNKSTSSKNGVDQGKSIRSGQNGAAPLARQQAIGQFRLRIREPTQGKSRAGTALKDRNAKLSGN